SLAEAAFSTPSDDLGNHSQARTVAAVGELLPHPVPALGEAFGIGAARQRPTSTSQPRRGAEDRPMTVHDPTDVSGAGADRAAAIPVGRYVPEATVARLATYFRVLGAMGERQITTV